MAAKILTILLRDYRIFEGESFNESIAEQVFLLTVKNLTYYLPFYHS